jgi:hypothetical protein
MPEGVNVIGYADDLAVMPAPKMPRNWKKSLGRLCPK